MKKQIVLLIIIIGIISCKTNNNDLKESGLNGSVKKIIDSNYDGIQKFGEWEKVNNLKDKMVREFDKQGNLIKIEFSNEYGCLTRWIYDNMGDTSVVKCYSYNPSGNLYDEVNQPYVTKKIREFKENKTFEKEFDSKGNLLSILELIKEFGRIIKETRYNETGEKRYEQYYSYFDDGKMKEATLIFFTNETADTTTTKFDILKVDDFNNIIKRLTIENKKEYLITERTIEYY